MLYYTWHNIINAIGSWATVERQISSRVLRRKLALSCLLSQQHNNLPSSLPALRIPLQDDPNNKGRPQNSPYLNMDVPTFKPAFLSNSPFPVVLHKPHQTSQAISHFMRLGSLPKSVLSEGRGHFMTIRWLARLLRILNC